MRNISAFRLGNYALFDGELQRITTQTGVENSAFLDPMPISIETFTQLGYIALKKNSDFTIYRFKTFGDDGISVIFNAHKDFLILEQSSQIEFPFIKWVHELQNLIEDKAEELINSDETAFKRNIVVR